MWTRFERMDSLGEEEHSTSIETSLAAARGRVGDLSRVVEGRVDHSRARNESLFLSLSPPRARFSNAGHGSYRVRFILLGTVSRSSSCREHTARGADRESSPWPVLFRTFPFLSGRSSRINEDCANHSDHAYGSLTSILRVFIQNEMGIVIRRATAFSTGP